VRPLVVVAGSVRALGFFGLLAWQGHVTSGSRRAGGK
jgi:hypothetical protein